jgi:threonine dehydrogenase-like Zn-dependent dehydrogenase
MRAVIVTPGQKQSARVADVPEPTRQSDECLVRVLEVGIDGTDRDIDAGRYGDAPPRDDYLILGHESLGQIVEAPRGMPFHAGDLVVATVRRPCPERCVACREGDCDFCASGNYDERGIRRRHGYLAEQYVECPEYLIPIPRELRHVAVLLEPLSIVEKAFREIFRIQQRLPWRPRRILITGAGGVGVLASCIARLRGFQPITYSRGASTGAGDALRKRLDIAYVDSDKQSLQDAVGDDAPDIVIEATGFSPLAWQCAEVVGLNGVVCLLSVTGGEKTVELKSDALNDRMVLGNRLMFGSVNSSRDDFLQGVKDLVALKHRWPGAIESMITRRLPLDQVREAIDNRPHGDLKTVLEIAS